MKQSKTNKAKFMYAVGTKIFNKLSEAKKFANETEANEILLMRGTSEQILYLYHPMSERFERICKVNDAKKRMNKQLPNL